MNDKQFYADVARLVNYLECWSFPRMVCGCGAVYHSVHKDYQELARKLKAEALAHTSPNNTEPSRFALIEVDK